MISVGITGQPGFVGTHLFDALGQQPDKFKSIPFEDAFFEDESKLRDFVKQCDVIVHLAAMMRSPIEGEVYKVNMRLVHQLVDAIDAEKVAPCILFSSSIQEGNGSEYGRCKQEGREFLQKWCSEHNTGFIGMLFPNLFGPGARPFSHSFIATFCYLLSHDGTPHIDVDNTIKLKYIDSLVKGLLMLIPFVFETKSIMNCQFVPDYEYKVSSVLDILESIKNNINEGNEPKFLKQAEEDLYTTYLSYVDYKL